MNIAMSVSVAVNAFYRCFNVSFLKPNEAMKIIFSVGVNTGDTLHDVHTQSRMVYVLVIRHPVKWQGHDTHLPVVLWKDRTGYCSYCDIDTWDIILDCKPDVGEAIEEKVRELAGRLQSTHPLNYKQRPLESYINFMPHGDPGIITHEGFEVSPDRKTCIVKF